MKADKIDKKFSRGVLRKGIKMERAHEVASEFLRRLENDELKKEHLPNQVFEVSKEVVEEELKRYNEFLKSDFFEELCRE